MSDLLAEMAASSRERVPQEVAVTAPPGPPLRLGGFDVIAEVKLVAPSAGVLSRPRDPAGEAARRATTYASGGAAAVSVLTEPLRFGGALEHLAAAAARCPVPCMRKDFLVDPRQVVEARAAGAGGVLLIARMLDDAALAALVAAAREHGLFVLYEAFDAEDLARVPEPWPGLLVGVNTRDLRTLAVRADRLERLVPHLPAGVPWVAESGIETPEDASRVAGLGYRLALVGTALMRSPDPGALVRDLVAAGRSACS